MSKKYKLMPVTKNDATWHDFSKIVNAAFQCFDPEKDFSRAAKRTWLLFTVNDKSIGAATFDDFENGEVSVRALSLVPEERGREGHVGIFNQMIDDFARAQGIRKLCVNATGRTPALYAKGGYVSEVWDINEVQDSGALQMTKTL